MGNGKAGHEPAPCFRDLLLRAVRPRATLALSAGQRQVLELLSTGDMPPHAGAAHPVRRVRAARQRRRVSRLRPLCVGPDAQGATSRPTKCRGDLALNMHNKDETKTIETQEFALRKLLTSSRRVFGNRWGSSFRNTRRFIRLYL